MKIAQECGQRWYAWHSWRRGRLLRRINTPYSSGFAVGPIMIFWKVSE